MLLGQDKKKSKITSILKKKVKVRARIDAKKSQTNPKIKDKSS